MSQFLETKKDGYRAQRTASLGAGITLVSGCNEFTALFDCARHCANILGDRELQELGDGIFEVIPSFKIPVEDLYSVLQKLSTKYSVALVEYAMTRNGGQFVLLWRIMPTAKPPPSTNLDDY